MSMDIVYERACVLERELTNFNERLHSAIDTVENAHQSVAPLWNDSMRQEYDKSWLPLEASMEDYLKRTGPNYVNTLIDRLQHLKNYLHGS